MIIQLSVLYKSSFVETNILHGIYSVFLNPPVPLSRVPENIRVIDFVIVL